MVLHLLSGQHNSLLLGFSQESRAAKGRKERGDMKMIFNMP
jgi:hypothetical protein